MKNFSLRLRPSRLSARNSSGGLDCCKARAHSVPFGLIRLLMHGGIRVVTGVGVGARMRPWFTSTGAWLLCSGASSHDEAVPSNMIAAS